MDGWKTIVLATVALATGGAAADIGTNMYAEVHASTTNVFLGEVFAVDVVVKAPRQPQPPDLGSLEDFNVTMNGPAQPMKEPGLYLFRYAFRARHEGELAIPPLSFSAAGETIRSQPVGIVAAKPRKSDRMALESTLSKQTAYVGEPVLLTTVWDSTYQLGALKAVDFSFPVLNDPDVQILDLNEPETGQATGLPVQGTRVLASRKNYKVNGVQHQSLAFEKLLVPKKAGKLTIPPSTLLCAADKEKNPTTRQGQRGAFQYPAYFDNAYFDQNVTGDSYERIYAESRPIPLDVLPLPAEGRPELFGGLVGEYSISVEATPTEVRVGEPVTLAVTVASSNYVENIVFPPLRYQPLLAGRFEIPMGQSLPEVADHAKIYTQTIRPLSTAISNVPPLELSFFSPDRREYVTVRSQPIPLKVSPAEPVAAYGMSGVFRTQLQSAEGGIRQNYVKTDLLVDRRPPLFGWAHPAIVLALLLLPPLAAGGVALGSLLGARRHHIRRTAKAARAYRTYRRNAAHIAVRKSTKSGIYIELDQVLRAYLGDRLHLVPGALSFREAQAALAAADVPAAATADLAELFAVCESYRFTQGFDEPTEPRAIIHRANIVVKSVEKALR